MSPRIHVILMQHGNHGHDCDFIPFEKELRSQIEQLQSDDVFYFHRTQNTGGIKTSQGLQILAESALENLFGFLEKEVLEYKQETIGLSFVGHSLGGLICRKMAQIMYIRDDILHATHSMYREEERTGTLVFENYISLNCPHLGARRPKNGLYNNLVNNVCYYVLGLTGLELQLLDNDDTIDEKPLIEKMAMEGLGYLESLREFKTMTTIAVIHSDHAVPLKSSSLRWSENYISKLNKVTQTKAFWQITGHSGFSHDDLKIFPQGFIVDESFEIGIKPIQEVQINSLNETDAIEMKECLNWTAMSSLQKLPWRRIEFEYNPMSPLYFFFVHDFSLSKRQWHTDLSLEATRFFCSVLTQEFRK